MRLATIALLLALCSPVDAAAQSSAPASSREEQARALFERAQIHFNVGEFKPALKLYKQAYKLRPLPGFLFNIAQCHRHLREYERAVFHYKMYLQNLPDAPNRAETEQLIAECEAHVRAPEYVPRAPKEARPAPPPKRGSRGLHRAWFWSGVALGGALLVTGTVCGALNLSMSHEYNDPSTSVERRRELKDTGEALGLASGVTLGVGAAVAVSATVLYFFTDFRGSDRVSFSPTMHGGTIGVRGRF